MKTNWILSNIYFVVQHTPLKAVFVKHIVMKKSLTLSPFAQK